MDALILKQPNLDLSENRVGGLQTSGPLSVLPIFGRDHGNRFLPPLSGLKLAGVHGYGNVEVSCPGDSGVAILPLHMGYIQEGAQNHALCRSAFVGAGQSLKVSDACCVQQAQGGYLKQSQQWFFVLPAALRERALALRGVENFGKLWGDLSAENSRFGLESVGHIEPLIGRQRPFLTQYAHRFELLEGQTGALFFLGEQLVGLEVTPNAAYFRELWYPLVCFSYGPAAMWIEQRQSATAESAPRLTDRSLADLRIELTRKREQRRQRLLDSVPSALSHSFESHDEDRYAALQLVTLEGRRFSGQVVRDEESLVYASLFANREMLLECSRQLVL